VVRDKWHIIRACSHLREFRRRCNPVRTQRHRPRFRWRLQLVGEIG